MAGRPRIQDRSHDGARLVVGAVVLALAGVLVTGAFAAQASTDVAATDVSVTLVSSSDGTSGVTDAIEVERSTYGSVLSDLATTGASVTLPTTIVGFPAVEIDGTTVQTDDDTAMVAFTGEADSIFGQDFPLPIDVLILVDWDETDAEDDAPRVVVSGRLADQTLGDLVGLDDGSIVADMALPAGALTVTNVPDPSIPEDGEELLDPTTFPTAARDFFEPIDGAEVRDELPLRGAINFQAAVEIGGISPAVNAATGFDATDVIALDGSVGLTLEDFPASGAKALSGMSFRAATPDLELPPAIVDVLGLDDTTVSGVFEIAATDSDTPDDPDDDVLRVAFTSELTTAAPLPEVDAELGIEVITTGPDDVVVAIGASIGNWSQPFGIEWLELNDLGLAATIEGTRSGGSPTVTVALEGDADIAGKNVTVSLEGELASPPSMTLAIDLNDPVSLGELMAALDLDPDGTVPGHVRNASFGPASLLVDVSPDGDGGTTVTASAAGDFEFFLHADAENPVAATLFLEFVVGGTPEFAVGIRPNGDLRLSDVVAGATPDFELVSDDAAFGFLFTTAGVSADSLDDLSAPAQQFFGPILGDDDASLDVPAGFSVLGTIVLPEELAELVGDTLGLQNRVEVTGTVPIDPGGELRLAMALALDPDKTPDWIQEGELSFAVSAASTGVSVELAGSLTVRFRSGMDPEIAADLAELGIDVHADEPVAEDHDCPGAAQTQESMTDAGSEFRCYDLLTFSVEASVTATPTSAKADLLLALDTAVMGDDYGWKPFGLEWLTINRVALKVGLAWDAASPPPGLKVTIGVSGDVEVNGKDLLASAKISVQPIPSPPFATVNLEGFRLASDAGFELDDFFAIQHDIAEAAARVAGDDPASVPGPFDAASMGIPNVALRNLDFSMSTKGDGDLCIPQGLFISADLYVDPTGEPTVRGPKCGAGGAEIPPVAGSTCGENADKGCLVGARIAVSADGFTALGELNGFELGPIVFDDGLVDLALTTDERHLLLRGGVAIDPIGAGDIQVSLEQTGTGVLAAFAGKVDIGPIDDPFFTALAEGSVGFDLADIESSGIELRFVLDASNLDIEQLGRDFEVEAKAAVDAATVEVITILDTLRQALTDFKDDPAQFVNDRLDELGIEVPAALQPLIDALADLAGEGVEAAEAQVLRGEIPGVPAAGTASGPVCPVATPQLIGGRCYTLGPNNGLPDGGNAKETLCPVTSPVLSGGRCYVVPPNGIAADGVPADGSASSSECPITEPNAAGGRCYARTPGTGFPAGGVAKVYDLFADAYVCPFTEPNEEDGRCYNGTPSSNANGVPSGGVARVTLCPVINPFLEDGRCYLILPGLPVPAVGIPDGGVANSGVGCHPTTPQEQGGRCYTTLPFGGLPDGGDSQVTGCPNITTPLLVGGRCYTLPPVHVVGLCDVYTELPSDCTGEDVIELLIKPSVLDIAGITNAVFEELSGIVIEIGRAFSLECAEFHLVLDGSTQAVDVDVTMKVGGALQTFGLGWDLSQSLDHNLADVIEGLKGAASEGCEPIEFVPFADDVFQDDGGELLHEAVLADDSFQVVEDRSIVADPLANDTNVETATITGLSVGGAGVLGEIGSDGETIVFTAVDDLAPGTTRVIGFNYSVTNASGGTSSASGTVTLVGANNVPRPGDDTAHLDLGAGDSILIDVLGNDTDDEDGTVGTISSVDASSGGCASIEGGAIRFTAMACDGSEPYAELAAGEVLVDEFHYAVRDSHGGTASGTVLVSVVGENDAPSLAGVRISRRALDKGEVVTVSGRIVDPDDGDTHQVLVRWGDGTEEIITLGGTAPAPAAFAAVRASAVGPQTTATFRASHTYARSGFFTPTFTVIDAAGAEQTARVFTNVESTASPTPIDADDDGYPVATDCRDTIGTVNPGAEEIPYDGIDNDCSGADLVDVDGDGSPSTAAVGGTPDCDDTDPAIGPAADEIPEDGVDNDCDGDVDVGVDNPVDDDDAGSGNEDSDGSSAGNDQAQFGARGPDSIERPDGSTGRSGPLAFTGGPGSLVPPAVTIVLLGMAFMFVDRRIRLRGSGRSPR